MSYAERNERILSMRGIYSYSLIAQKLGVTRNTVAGVCFRADHPAEIRICSPNSKVPNKIGIGRHGNGDYADYTLWNVA